MSVLLPEGVPLLDAPYFFVEAFNAGLTFLSFLEMSEDDRPPREIWLDGDRLAAHFEERDRRRKEEYGIDGHKAIEGPVSQNPDQFWAD